MYLLIPKRCHTCAPSLFCFHISPPERKVAPTSSERLPAAPKVGCQRPMPWSLKPRSLLVPPPRHPHEYSRATALNGAQVTPGNVQEINQRSGSISPHIQRASPLAGPGSRHLENVFLCFPPPHPARRHPPALSTQTPLSSAVPSKGQKMPICRAVCLKSTWRTYLAGSPFRFPFR